MPPNRVKIFFLNRVLPAAVTLLATFCCYSSLITRNAHGNLTHMLKWDALYMTYPKLVFNSDCMRSLIFPLWNPYNYGGMPWVSNFQACLFYPLNLLITVFGKYNLEVFQMQIALTFFIAGCNMYLALRSFALSRTASLAGGIFFLSCGFFVGHAEHFTSINTLAFLPLAVMALNRVLDTVNIRVLSWGSLSVSLLVFSANPQLLVNSLGALLIFGALKIFFIDKTTDAKTVSRKIIYLAGFFILGLAISAVLLVPALESIALSYRCQEGVINSARRDSLPIAYLIGVIYPFIPRNRLTPYPVDISCVNFSIGIVGAVFAICCLFFNNSRLKWSLLIIFIIGVVMSMGDLTPVSSYLIRMTPFARYMSHPAENYGAIFMFVLCLFSGLGVQEILASGTKAPLKISVSVIIFLLLAASISLWFNATRSLDIWACIIDNRLPLTVSIFMIMCIIFLSRAVLSRTFFCAALILFCIIDSSQWVAGNFSTVANIAKDESWEYVKKTERLRDTKNIKAASLKRLSGTYPIDSRHSFAAFEGYFSNTGYDPVILKSYDEIMRSAASGVVTEDFRVLPVYETRILPDEAAVLSEIKAGADLHKIALVSEGDLRDRSLISRLKGLSCRANPGFSAKIIRFEPNIVYYNVKTDIPVLIFFNEIWYPGWRLYAGHKRLPLFRVNHTFRGTYLEPGQYYLKMVFFPLSFKIGLAISMVAILFNFYLINLWGNDKMRCNKRGKT